MRVKATIEYLGTAYAGWQLQPDRPTVQGELEKALAIATRAPRRIAGAGRTDAGVHALGQVASFDVDDGTDLFRLRLALDSLTPHDIAVLALEEVSPDFDPRRAAVARRYRYTIVNSPAFSAFLRGRAWHVVRPMDRELLQRLASALVGDHEFSAFRASDCPSPRTWRTVTWSRWTFEGRILHYEIESPAFLKQMVRTLVGSMFDVDRGLLAESDFYGLLRGGARAQAGRTAPAEGLTLVSVRYPESVSAH